MIGHHVAYLLKNYVWRGSSNDMERELSEVLSVKYGWISASLGLIGQLRKNNILDLEDD